MAEYSFQSLGPTLEILTLIFLCVGLLVAVGVVVGLAALPGQIARARRHPQTMAVNVLGWLGLPTGVLWVLAMSWAFWRFPGPADASHDDSQDLKRLTGLVEQLEGALQELEMNPSTGGPA